MLTARNAEDDFSVPRHRIYQGIVSSRIACVQSYNHVSVVVFIVCYIAAEKAETAVAQVGGDFIAEIYYICFQIQPCYFHIETFHQLEVMIDSKGQISFAAAEIDDFDRLV